MASLDPGNFRIKRRGNGSKTFFLHECTVSSAGKPKIVKYNFQKLVRWTALSTLFHMGTVFRLDKAVFLQMGVYGFFFVLAFLSLWSTNDVQGFNDTSMSNILDVSNNVQRFCPFLFGMFVSNILTRWWNIRTKAVGAAADHIINISSLLVSMGARVLPDDDDWKLFLTVHAKVVKYGLASLTIMANESRQDQLGSDGKHWQELIDLGFLTAGEKDMLASSTNGAVVLWCWMSSVAAEAMEMMKIPPPNHNMLFQEIRSGVLGIHELHKYLKTQLPFPYVHMITLLVNVNNLVMAVVAGLKLAIAWDAGLMVVCGAEIIQFVLVPILYQGLLQICVFLSDPMGTDIIDFPVREYQMEVCDSCWDQVMTIRPLYDQLRSDGVAPLPNAHVLWKLGAPPKSPAKAPAQPTTLPAPAPLQAPAPVAAPAGQVANHAAPFSAAVCESKYEQESPLVWLRMERKFDELSERVSTCLAKGMEVGLHAMQEERLQALKAAASRAGLQSKMQEAVASHGSQNRRFVKTINHAHNRSAWARQDPAGVRAAFDEWGVFPDLSCCGGAAAVSARAAT